MYSKIFTGFWNLLRSFFGVFSAEEKQLFESRLNICKECKYEDRNFCGICGCYIYAKVKVLYDVDAENKSIDGCPEKYW